MSIDATLTWCGVGRLNKRGLTENAIGCSPTKNTEETGIKRVNRKSHRFVSLQISNYFGQVRP